MSEFTDDATDAARLIVLGMRPKQVPRRDLDYADLVRCYANDEDFADLVRAVANGFDLIVLDVNERSGMVLGPRTDSIFIVRIDEYARRSGLSGRGLDKVIHGLAHLATAAIAFPRPDDLANDTYVGYVAVDQVDAVVRDACRVLKERAAVAEENQDPIDTAPDLERAWRAYDRRPAASKTKDDRLATDSTRGMITKAVRFLADQGLLIQRAGDTAGAYRTTPRYQTMVRELAANAAFKELTDMGVITVTDPTGSLRLVGPGDTL